MSEQSIFIANNHHVPGCGEPPHITDKTPNQYRGYFENCYGEQAIFVYERTTRRGTLYMGDAGWDRPYEVRDGRVEDLIMNEAEQLWLLACWKAATEFEGDTPT